MTALWVERPCPFCGSEDLKLEDRRIVCASCGAKGPAEGISIRDADEEEMAHVWWGDRDYMTARNVLSRRVIL